MYPMPNIHKIFIANRGEIARRIGQAARKLNIRSVCPSEETTPQYLKEFVDEFVRVPNLDTAFYLDSQAMVRLAKASGADAVHPGFGFLSENPRFAKEVAAAGLTWIGPRPETIDQMASKANARLIAEQHHVPCTVGLSDIHSLDDANIKRIEAYAQGAPFPLLVKAVFGGGGKGMRIVHQASDLIEQCRRAHSEAKTAFGHGDLILEPYVTHARHVEVQILADTAGRTVALGDRDCSIQRRHQKIIEEAPAPFLPEETRRNLHESAISLASAVNYVGAGTVEFLVDWSEKAQESGAPPFYFLEMNTRLQVEHPVTEAVFDVDIVAWQIRIAQGEPLDPEVGAHAPSGHAVEARVYAEDPLHGFLPSPGLVAAFIPHRAADVRWEVGIDTVDTVSSNFDPMIAKCVAWGPTRSAAMKTLRSTLQRTVLAGPQNNLALVAQILSDRRFAAGAVATNYLDDELPRLCSEVSRDQTAFASLAQQPLESWLAAKNLHSGASADQSMVAACTDVAFAAGQQRTPQHEHVVSTGQTHFGLNGNVRSDLALSRIKSTDSDETILLHVRGVEGSFAFALRRGFQLQINLDHLHSKDNDGGLAESGKISSPVPGKIVDILVEQGTDVQEKQTIVVLESMKMEFQVAAPRPGIIKEVLVEVGQQVEAGYGLAIVDTD